MTAVDLIAVRTFVAVVEAGQFQVAAAELAITQQAVSKRVAALERDLGVALLTRTRGIAAHHRRAGLPPARACAPRHRGAGRRLGAAGGRRPLRVDVIGRRLSMAGVLRDFHRAHPEVDLDVVTLFHVDADAAVTAIRSGEIDASFRCVTMPGSTLPDGVEATARLRRAAPPLHRPRPRVR